MYSIKFHETYKPYIANPFRADATYLSIMPSSRMLPYIRCHWGSDCTFNPHTAPIYQNLLLIPDTCFDLILIKNYSSGQYRMLLTGANDSYSFDSWNEKDTEISIFAVRLNFWAMNIISPASMANTLNKALNPADIFPGTSEFCEKIFEIQSFKDRIAAAEQYIEKLIDIKNISDTFLNGTAFILKHQGALTLTQLSEHVFYSRRQVQRLFFEASGMTPKQLMNLIRYQSLWQEILHSKSIDYMSAVCKYSYTDQSHLTADFKKYHSVTPREAINSIISQNPNFGTPTLIY